MKSLERNSKKAFIVSIIAYLVFKTYNAINFFNTEMQGMSEVNEELKKVGQGGKIFVIAISIITTVLFILITYFICKGIFNSINKENTEMLERFSGIYFSNMTILYLFSIILIFLSTYLSDASWSRFFIIGGIKVLIAIGINLLLLDKEEDPDIRLVPNIVLFAVVFLF